MLTSDNRIHDEINTRIKTKNARLYPIDFEVINKIRKILGTKRSWNFRRTPRSFSTNMPCRTYKTVKFVRRSGAADLNAVRNWSIQNWMEWHSRNAGVPGTTDLYAVQNWDVSKKQKNPFGNTYDNQVVQFIFKLVFSSLSWLSSVFIPAILF